MKGLIKFSFVLVVFLGMTTVFSSCYKKKDTIAVITVVDADNNPVAGAEVKLFWSNTSLPEEAVRENLEQIATSDGSGKASFNYNELYKSGQGGVFVLDVYVNEVVVGIIKIKQEEKTEVTVVVD
jgi:hypothetical protein